jgi:uncharacterized protein (TIGR03643 family)
MGPAVDTGTAAYQQRRGGAADAEPCTTIGAMAKPVPRLSAEEIQQVIAVAWDDKPPFTAVLHRHGLTPGQVVQLLKRELTPNAFKVWKARSGALPRPAARRAPAKKTRR